MFLSENHGWQLITEPPVTIGADICKYIEATLRLNYPCHSQTVEHAMQIKSSVALLSTNYKSRLGAAQRSQSMIVERKCQDVFAES